MSGLRTDVVLITANPGFSKGTIHVSQLMQLLSRAPPPLVVVGGGGGVDSAAAKKVNHSDRVQVGNAVSESTQSAFMNFEKKL